MEGNKGLWLVDFLMPYGLCVMQKSVPIVRPIVATYFKDRLKFGLKMLSKFIVEKWDITWGKSQDITITRYKSKIILFQNFDSPSRYIYLRAYIPGGMVDSKCVQDLCERDRYKFLIVFGAHAFRKFKIVRRYAINMSVTINYNWHNLFKMTLLKYNSVGSNKYYILYLHICIIEICNTYVVHIKYIIHTKYIIYI